LWSGRGPRRRHRQNGADHDNFCGGSTGTRYYIPDTLLDGSGLSGGVTELEIMVKDSAHGGSGWSNCRRGRGTCAVSYR
jgi:hypothetical protein